MTTHTPQHPQHSLDPPSSVGERPVVRVLWDPDDTSDCVTALNARHDLDAGVVVCHPSPGMPSAAVLGEDILVALGKHPGGPAVERLTGRRWELARWWLAGERVQHLVVLRAHQLSAPLWHALAELTAATATTLWLVVHQPAVHGRHRAALAAHGYPDPLPVRPWWATLEGLPEPAPAQPEFPTVPDVEFPLFRATARRVLDPDEFARVDQVYQASFHTARTEAQRWNRPGHLPSPGTPAQVAALLQRHTINAASHDEFQTRTRALQAGVFTAGFLLHLGNRKPYPLGSGPRLHDTTVARLRGLCSPSVAAALTLHRVTGLDPVTMLSLRLPDVLDTGTDLLITAKNTDYRVPARAAGALRATVLQRRAQLTTQLNTQLNTTASTASTAPWLFAGQFGGNTTQPAYLQRRIDRAGAYTGLTPTPPQLHDVQIIDLHDPP